MRERKCKCVRVYVREREREREREKQQTTTSGDKMYTPLRPESDTEKETAHMSQLFLALQDCPRSSSTLVMCKVKEARLLQPIA